MRKLDALREVTGSGDAQGGGPLGSAGGLYGLQGYVRGRLIWPEVIA